MRYLILAVIAVLLGAGVGVGVAYAQKKVNAKAANAIEQVLAADSEFNAAVSALEVAKQNLRSAADKAKEALTKLTDVELDAHYANVQKQAEEARDKEFMLKTAFYKLPAGDKQAQERASAELASQSKAVALATEATARCMAEYSRREQNPRN